MTTPPDIDDASEPTEPAQGSSPARTNRLAITALITGVIGLAVIAIGLAVAALFQMGRRGERGRALAFAALAVSGCWLAAATALLVSTRGDEDSPAPEAQVEGPLASALNKGDCFNELRQVGTTVLVEAASCTFSHQGEVIGKPTLPILDYPGDGRLVTEGEKACRVEASTLYAAGIGNEFTLVIGRPSKKAWEGGQHTVTCLLRYTGGPKDFRLEGQWTSINLLAEGDCLETWSDKRTMNVVDCTRKHKAQVLAKIDLTSEKNSDEGLIYAICAEQARRLPGPLPSSHQLRLGGPTKREWASGQHYALCLAVSKDAPTTSSLLPE